MRRSPTSRSRLRKADPTPCTDRLPPRRRGDDPRRHRAARDDPGRRGRGRASRRPVPGPRRQARDPAAGRPPAADHRRRARRPRVRHRGALKITPGHDPNDFEIGRAHSLPSSRARPRRPADRSEAELASASRSDHPAPSVAVVKELAASTPLGRSPYVHSVPFSHRSGERIEPPSPCSGSAAWTSWRSRPSGRAPRRPRAVPRPVRRRSTSTGWSRSAPGASRASSGGATGCPSGTRRRLGAPTSSRASVRTAGLRRSAAPESDVLDTRFSLRALAVRHHSGWPADTPELATCYPGPPSSSRPARSSTSG